MNQLIPFNDAVRPAAEALRVEGNRATVRKWRTSGLLVGGEAVVLRAVQLGSRFYTSPEWVREWLARVAPSTPA